MAFYCWLQKRRLFFFSRGRPFTRFWFRRFGFISREVQFFSGDRITHPLYQLNNAQLDLYRFVLFFFKENAVLAIENA